MAFLTAVVISRFSKVPTFTLGSVCSSVQSRDQLGHWGDVRDDSAEILFQSFLQEGSTQNSAEHVSSGVSHLCLGLFHDLYRHTGRWWFFFYLRVELPVTVRCIAGVRNEVKMNNMHKHYKATGQAEDRQERVVNITALTAGTLTITLCTLSVIVQV